MLDKEEEEEKIYIIIFVRKGKLFLVVMDREFYRERKFIFVVFIIFLFIVF